MRIFRVSAFFPDVTQQAHSLRASGVMSPQVAFAFGEIAIAFPRSFGILCTAPEAAAFMAELYHSGYIAIICLMMSSSGLMVSPEKSNQTFRNSFLGIARKPPISGS